MGATGRSKRLGDFDAADVEVMQTWYRDEALRATARSEWCGQLRRRMRSGDTLKTMATDGRLQEADLGFLRARSGELATCLKQMGSTGAEWFLRPGSILAGCEVT